MSRPTREAVERALKLLDGSVLAAEVRALRAEHGRLERVRNAAVAYADRARPSRRRSSELAELFAAVRALPAASERTAARPVRLEPCDCGHPRGEHTGHEDGDGECERDDCECGVYEARGWE